MSESSVTVETLIAQARTDRAALGQLLERYRPFLEIITRLEMGPSLARREDVSDIVQITMLKACKAFPTFRGTTEAAFSGWIRIILDNSLADAGRKRHPVGWPISGKDGSALSVFDPPGSQTSPSQRMIKGEQALRLAELLSKLPAMQREAIIMRHLEGLHLDEIARLLNRSETAAAGLLKRGLAKLRDAMSEDSWL